ncbi:hypothetical protein [Mycobacterium xenopi]|nr:hypothetical protein [Mycobacterium xenopi]MDA3641835.1 hypothetical protein [Mycobacterium xenopi]MDA3659824.1 hypothetical protein [Mycobacterium xenopi]
MATMLVDADVWEARVHSLCGSGNALLAALAARQAQRRGRLTADGLVAVQIPVNERTAGDTRANAVSNVGVLVAPVPVTKDLRELRAASNTR